MTKTGEDELCPPPETASAEEPRGWPAFSKTPDESHSSEPHDRWGAYQPAVTRFVRTRSPAARKEAKLLFEEMAAQRVPVAEALTTCNCWLAPILRSNSAAERCAALESLSELQSLLGEAFDRRGQAEARAHLRLASAYSQKTREVNTLLDSLPALAFLKDAEFRYVAVNRVFCEALAARGKSTTMHKVLGKENILVYNCFMAMGRRNQRQRQKGLWVAAADLPQTAAHPFYRRLNELLDEHGFDDFAEQRCEQFYAAHMGRPSLTPGSYFRCLLIGYLEGIDSERGIAWRLADSISLRRFLAIELDESTPDHSTISRTRRLIDVETHREVFTWVLQLLAKQGLLKGGTIAVDATTLEASAALRSIVRRDSGESYEEFLRGLAAESGIETPSREQLAKLDKKRKNKGSNKDWTNPHDPDAKIAKMKDGRTHLAHKAEHAVDLETGALLALTLQGADLGDTTTVSETISAAAQQVAAVAQDQEANEQLSPQGLQEVVADKGYHSNDVLTDLTALEMRSYINEPDRGRRNWCGKPRQQQAVYGNRRRMRGKRGKQLSRLRGERVERSFAHLYETGRMRRTHLRGHENILKRLLIHGGAFNLSLVLRKERGAGTPRGLAEAKKAFDWLLETVRRPFSAGRTLLLRLWPHPANTPFRLQSQSCVFGPARTA